MKKTVTIGLLGFTATGSNLGCVALTYSMLIMLENIRKTHNHDFKYCLFDSKYNPQKIDLLCEKCQIEKERIEVCAMSDDNLGKKIYCHINVYKKLLECFCIIDITAGDSFSDIYGLKQYNYYTRFKHFSLLCKKKFILAPQTFGPFEPERIEKAATIIKKSSLAISRDELSVEFFRDYCGNKIVSTTDIAFLLPFVPAKTNQSSKLKVGINVSSLLFPTGKEQTFNRKKLNTDYKKYVCKLIEFLIQSECYEIFLISHVQSDFDVAEYISKTYQNCTLVPFFTDPIEAKSFISSLDVFIGSRMHATIAAFSSGVCTIPVAYSRKFKGLYQKLDYQFIIDLCSLSTDEAFNQTVSWLAQTDVLTRASKESMVKAVNLCHETERLIASELQDKQEK